MRILPCLVAIALLAACSSGLPEAPRAAAPEPAKAPDTVAERSDRPVVVAFGDSLTAGYGVDPDQSYPAQLQAELDQRGFDYRVINEGVSGDTTAVGLSRVGMALSHEPQWVILALGANDGLRGLPVEAMEENLRTMVEQFQESGARVVLAGMTLPGNYGQDYIASFEAVFPRLAKEYSLPFLQFLLEGVAAEPELNQDDGIHPTAEGNRMVAEHVADFLAPLLDSEASE